LKRLFQSQTGSTGHFADQVTVTGESVSGRFQSQTGSTGHFAYEHRRRPKGEDHYSGTFPQGHFPGNFPPNGMMANNVPMTHFSPEAFSQEYSLEQQTLRALPVLM